MGQGGMCGVTMPGTESLPPMPETADGGSINGIAVEMQVRPVKAISSVIGFIVFYVYVLLN